MHAPWYMAGTSALIGQLEPPIFSLAGEPTWDIQHSINPYDILLESDPRSYPLTYRTHWGFKYALEPTHIDDGIRVDAGFITVPRTIEFPGVPLTIAARSFDPSGFLAPSRASYGWYNYTGGGIITFDPPSGTTFTGPGVIMMYAPGHYITVSNALDTFPPVPGHPTVHPYGGRDQTQASFTRHFRNQSDTLYLTARAWAPSGHYWVAAGPAQYAVYYAEGIW